MNGNGVHHEASSGVILGGWVSKRVVERGCFGRKVVWRKRWLQLQDRRLCCCLQEKGKEEKTIELTPDTPVSIEGHDGRTLAVVAEESWAFRLDSVEETKRWMDLIKEARMPKQAPPAEPSTPDALASPSHSEASFSLGSTDDGARAERLKQLREARSSRKQSYQMEALEALAAIDNLEE